MSSKTETCTSGIWHSKDISTGVSVFGPQFEKLHLMLNVIIY